MTKTECIIEITKRENYRNWSKEDIEELAGEVLEECLEEDIKKGYGIFDFDRTGMLEIEKIDSLAFFEDDEEATKQAIKDGVKIIPIEELPENFNRKYLGWINTPENRKAIEDYCKIQIVESDDVEQEF